VQRISMVLLMLYAFAVPWEYSFDLGEPLGNVARMLGILLLLAAIPAVLRRGVFRKPGAAQWLVLALYLYFACSYFWTVDTQATLSKLRAYFQVMMVVWIAWEVAERPRELRALLRSFVAGCGVLAILTLLNYASANASANAAALEQIRFVAEGQDPNDVARFLDLGFPLAALLFATDSRWVVRLLAICYVPAGLLAVLLTASRGGFSGAFAALVGSAMVLVVWRPRAASMIFLGLAATASALWLYVPADSVARLLTIPEQISSGDLNERLGIWVSGWHAFRLAPWWGYGAGTFAGASHLATEDTAHNTVMAVLVTGGLAGTAIFSATLAAVVRAAARTQGLVRVAMGTVLVVWTITSMVGSVEENRTTWLLFGLIGLAGRFEAEQAASMSEMFSGCGREETGEQVYAVR
jgi:O-antigen ligase